MSKLLNSPYSNIPITLFWNNDKSKKNEWNTTKPSYIEQTTRNFSKGDNISHVFEDNKSLPTKYVLSIRIDGIEYEFISDFENFLSAIEQSKYLINYSEEDPETGKITIYKKQTWEKTIVFLLYFAKWAYNSHEVIIPTPTIFDGPNGSIDVQWKSQDFRLLMNFDAESNYATFYGDNFGEESVKGKIDLKIAKKFNLLSILSILTPNYELAY